jgi:hypothetical protein
VELPLVVAQVAPGTQVVLVAVDQEEDPLVVVAAADTREEAVRGSQAVAEVLPPIPSPVLPER